MIAFDVHTQVYLAVGATDMRKSIDGLAAVVAQVLAADPFSSHLFVFCNRGKDKIKVLFWHHNGFWLWYRRLERQRFWWPNDASGGAVTLSVRELGWLLEGLDPRCVAAHRRTEFSLL
jgi:transposase